MTAATPSALPVLILHTGDPDETLKSQFGGYAEQLLRAAGLPPGGAEIVAVYEGQRPQAPSCYRAALITGSPAMVSDKEPWSEEAAAWLRDAMAAGLPMFGVCYGHQLLAHALGGKVGYNPAGREVGTQTVELLPTATGDTLMAGVPSTFPAQMLHAQTVLELPPGAAVLARSDLDEHQMIRIGRNVFSTQFHPEFGPDFIIAHLERYGRRYAAENLDVPGLTANVRATPVAGGLLRRFLETYAPGA
ncbi:glutamine amidotransferase [Achromobacter sp.]|uniref:glutamine amidotransferase n=1 Tax=Achromobacter sp. TaxID=134375 RepID=UPI0028A9DEEE|nr:glutamine amidotransferase [Achromobacter sp.]